MSRSPARIADDEDRPFDADEEVIIRLVVKFIVDKIRDDAAKAQAADAPTPRARDPATPRRA